MFKSSEGSLSQTASEQQGNEVLWSLLLELPSMAAICHKCEQLLKRRYVLLCKLQEHQVVSVFMQESTRGLDLLLLAQFPSCPHTCKPIEGVRVTSSVGNFCIFLHTSICAPLSNAKNRKVAQRGLFACFKLRSMHLTSTSYYADSLS